MKIHIQPTISVVMAAYNAEKHIDEAIQSILDQTHTDFEFIIINDGSTDRTQSIIKKYQKNDTRILLLNNRENKGLPFSLNTGIKVAKGKYIARMDADDVSLHNRLATQFRYLQEHSSVGLVSTQCYLIGTKDDPNRWRRTYSPEEIFYLLHFRNCIIHPSVMFKRNSFMEIGGYDIHYLYSQDYELWSRLSKIIKFYQIPKPFLLLRKTNNSISSEHSRDQILASHKIALRSLKQLGFERITNNQLDHILNIGNLNKQTSASTLKILRELNKAIFTVEKQQIQNLNLDKSHLLSVMNKFEFKILTSSANSGHLHNRLITLSKYRKFITLFGMIRYLVKGNV